MSYFKKSNLTETDEHYLKAQAFLPTLTFHELKKISQERQLPMSKLISIAIENELEQEHPFNFPIEFPHGEYEEDKYTNEAAKLLRFLNHMPGGGLPIDSMKLFHREIGVPRDLIVYALRELLEKHMVTEYFNPRSKYQYPKHYMHYRPKVAGKKKASDV